MKNILKIFTVLFLTLNIMPVLAVDDSDASSQSKANRLLTSASSAATGIGTMELAQGLSEQKADKAADADMSAYISTMRCSYGNGKSVKAGADEIELPGGNDANLMKYRSEYTALANDLKERKTALNMMPGIESEEILDKSQIGLYDDENVGITAGNYASRYRAQMLGSESDQTQLDEAAQTSKTRVIGGVVAAGVGVVGGIVGDELINQSLSSSTKTAQTCTESGGTWQGARCHCPDGYIQRTKTGPCFEEKTTEVQTIPVQQTPNNQGNSATPQDNSNILSNDGNSGQPGADDGDDLGTQSNLSNNGDDDKEENNSGPNSTRTAVNDLNLFDTNKNLDTPTQIGIQVLEDKNNVKKDETKSEDVTTDNGYTIINGKVVPNKLDLKTPDVSVGTGLAVSSVAGAAANVTTTSNPATNTDTATSSSATTHRDSNTTSKTETNKSDSPDTNISSTTKSKNTKADEAQSNTNDTEETEQKKVKERPSQNSSKNTSSPQRANTTATQTSSKNKNGKKVEYIHGTFEDAQVTESQAKQLIKVYAQQRGIKNLNCDNGKESNTKLICKTSDTDYHFFFEDLTESFPRTQKKSIAMTVCKIFGGKKQTDLDTGLASRIHCEIDFNVCRNELNNALRQQFNQKSYIYNVYSSSGNGATKTLSRQYCAIEW